MCSCTTVNAPLLGEFDPIGAVHKCCHRFYRKMGSMNAVILALDLFLIPV